MRSRLATLIAARVVVGTVLLGSATLVQLSRPGAFPVDPFFFLIGLTYGLSILAFLSLRLVDRWPWLLDLQLAADAILVSGFILVTGGVTSVFSFLYLLPIIAAATVRSRAGAMQVAVLSALLYLGMVTVQYADLPLLPARLADAAALPSLRFAQFTVAINLSGFLAVAMLAGSLAERARTAGRRLAHASSENADLRAFNAHIVDSLRNGLLTTDREGRVLTFNRAAAVITGLSETRVIGHDVGGVLQLPPHVRTALGTMPEGGHLRFEIVYRREDGHVCDIGFTASPAAFPDGREGLLFTFQDTTDVRRLEREAGLRRRLADVGEMAAGIAHEIRNPLASMSGSIQLLREELALTEEQAQLMDIVLRESDRLNQTIRSFLAYARPQRAALVRLDLAGVLQDAVRLLRNSPEARDTHVVEVDLPPEPVWFDADEHQIRQIIWNLATNGLRAMRQGGRLSLAVRAVDAAVLMTVRDEGCGIPPEEVDAIFQPFRSSFEKGTGLGLSIVHRIVSGYQGTIEVTSSVGVGTTVSVRLPVRASVAPSAPDTAADGNSVAARFRGLSAVERPGLSDVEGRTDADANPVAARLLSLSDVEGRTDADSHHGEPLP